MKSRQLSVLAAGAMVCLLVGCASASTDGKDTGSQGSELLPVNLALQEGSGYYLTSLAGEREGIFKEEGVALRHVTITGGSGPVLAAMASGSVDVMLTGISVYASAIQTGQDLVAFCGDHSADAHSLIVAPDSDIPSLKDASLQVIAKALKGKRIGVNARGTMLEYEVRSFLEGQGVDPESVTYVAVGLGQPAQTALITNQVDAMIAYPFMDALLAGAGESRELFVFGPEVSSAGTSPVVYGATRKWVEQNRDAAEAFCRSIGKTAEWLADPANESVVGDMLGEFFGVKGDEALKASARFYEAFSTELPREKIEADLEYNVKAGILKPTPKVTYDQLALPVLG